MVASTAPCSSGDQTSPMTLGSTEELSSSREEVLAVATRVSRARDTWTPTPSVSPHVLPEATGASYLGQVHVALVQQSWKLLQHGFQSCGSDGGAVMRDQRRQTGQGAHLQNPLVLPQERAQLGQHFRQDGGQVHLEEKEPEGALPDEELFAYDAGKERREGQT